MFVSVKTRNMKKKFVFFLLLSWMLISSCDRGGGGNSCNDPQPLQPSFSQSAYKIKAGQTVTFTYTGPEQPKSVQLYWVTSFGPDQKFEQQAFGSTVTFTYEDVGSWGVTLKAYNCNHDQPRIDVYPCVTVSP